MGGVCVGVWMVCVWVVCVVYGCAHMFFSVYCVFVGMGVASYM